MESTEQRFYGPKVFTETHEILKALNRKFKTGIAPGYHRAVLLLQRDLEGSLSGSTEIGGSSNDSANVDNSAQQSQGQQ